MGCTIKNNFQMYYIESCHAFLMNPGCILHIFTGHSILTNLVAKNFVSIRHIMRHKILLSQVIKLCVTQMSTRPERPCTFLVAYNYKPIRKIYRPMHNNLESQHKLMNSYYTEYACVYMLCTFRVCVHVCSKY